jgi:hypothetical protein
VSRCKCCCIYCSLVAKAARSTGTNGGLSQKTGRMHALCRTLLLMLLLLLLLLQPTPPCGGGPE